MMTFRTFQGKYTKQTHLGRPALPDAWYWEPSNYDFDELWSAPYPTQDYATKAAFDSCSEEEEE